MKTKKFTKQQLKQLIKEELAKVLLHEDIDPAEYYIISGETIIELRQIANEIGMKDPTTSKFMWVLLSGENVQPL